MSVKNIVMSAAGAAPAVNPNFSTTSDPYAAYVIYNNRLVSTMASQNTTWSAGGGSFTTAPAGCPNSTALYFTQGNGYYYSNNTFGNSGMLDMTGSYTWEFWFYATGINTSYFSGQFLVLRGDGSGDANNCGFTANRGVFTNNNSSATSFNLNTWNHFACTRYNGARYYWINGVQVLVDYSAVNNGNPAHWEGADGHDFDMGYSVYLSNWRWTQAVRYTSTFTPTFVNFYGAA